MDPFLVRVLDGMIGGLIVLFLTPIWSDLYPGIKAKLGRARSDQRRRLRAAWAAYRHPPPPKPTLVTPPGFDALPERPARSRRRSSHRTSGEALGGLRQLRFPVDDEGATG